MTNEKEEFGQGNKNFTLDLIKKVQLKTAIGFAVTATPQSIIAQNWCCLALICQWQESTSYRHRSIG